MEQPRLREKAKRIAPAVILSLGLLGLGACDQNGEIIPQDNDELNQKISTFLGQIGGIYDENGDIIPHEETIKEIKNKKQD